MKFYFLFLIFFSFSVFAFEKVKINGQLYVADGFDDNDLVEITVVGSLPNSCYRNPTFEIDRRADNQFDIRLFAYYSPSEKGCRQVSMTYSETINFGMMYAGNYGISLINKKNTETKKLSVLPASTKLVDEFLYGNVRSISENEFNRDVELTGVNPVNCMVFQSMTADIQNSMIILKPHFKEVGTCENKPAAFKIKYSVPSLENQAKGILLHVRIMNGRSYNYLYQNRL